MNPIDVIIPTHAALARAAASRPTSPTRRTRPSMKRYGYWLLTYTGQKFYPMDPRPEEIRIEDIAHSLANICRFGGHSLRFYSVAQHSIIVSRACTQAPFQGLLHDATEAYCGDIIRPIKINMPEYRELESRIWLVVCERFGLAPKMHPEVKVNDNRALMTERRDILVHSDHEWSLAKDYPPLTDTIFPDPPTVAESVFLTEFRHYWKEAA